MLPNSRDVNAALLAYNLGSLAAAGVAEGYRQSVGDQCAAARSQNLSMRGTSR